MLAGNNTPLTSLACNVPANVLAVTPPSKVLPLNVVGTLNLSNSSEVIFVADKFGIFEVLKAPDSNLEFGIVGNRTRSKIPSVILDAFNAGIRPASNSPAVILNASKVGILASENSPPLILLALKTGILASANSPDPIFDAANVGIFPTPNSPETSPACTVPEKAVAFTVPTTSISVVGSVVPTPTFPVALNTFPLSSIQNVSGNVKFVSADPSPTKAVAVAVPPNVVAFNVAGKISLFNVPDVIFAADT